MQMNQFICCLYQNLTDFIWSFVYYQISIDLSKFIPDMDQAWEKKECKKHIIQSTECIFKT